MTFRHWKTGSLYKLLHLGVDSVKEVPVVVYQAGTDSTGPVWVRPAIDFFGKVKNDQGVEVDRFGLVL